MRSAGAALHRVLLVGGRGAVLLTPPLLAIAVEHGCAVTVYTIPDWEEALGRLVVEHRPDVVMVESAAPPPRVPVRCIWLQPRGAATPLEYAAWAAQAWRTAATLPLAL